jgi:hypothetical protein
MGAVADVLLRLSWVAEVLEQALTLAFSIALRGSLSGRTVLLGASIRRFLGLSFRSFSLAVSSNKAFKRLTVSVCGRFLEWVVNRLLVVNKGRF